MGANLTGRLLYLFPWTLCWLTQWFPKYGTWAKSGPWIYFIQLAKSFNMLAAGLRYIHTSISA